MRYYEIRDGDTIIGTCTSASMRRFQKKHCLVIAADEDHAEMVQADGEGERLFRADWMHQTLDSIRLASLADVIQIDREEYDSLSDQLMIASEIVDVAPEPDPVESDSESGTEEADQFGTITKLDIIEALTDMEMRISLMELGVQMAHDI